MTSQTFYFDQICWRNMPSLKFISLVLGNGSSDSATYE
jgi:hypothetical protein